MLIPTSPDLIRDAMRWPRAASPVHTVANNPYLTSFAIGIERIADLDLLRELRELRDDLVVERPLDEDPGARLTALPGRVVDRPGRARDRVGEVRVREDDVGTLAAELERDPLDRIGAEP